MKTKLSRKPPDTMKQIIKLYLKSNHALSCVTQSGRYNYTTCCIVLIHVLNYLCISWHPLARHYLCLINVFNIAAHYQKSKMLSQLPCERSNISNRLGAGVGTSVFTGEALSTCLCEIPCHVTITKVPIMALKQITIVNENASKGYCEFQKLSFSLLKPIRLIAIDPGPVETL